jgi:hypothetical protein
MIILQTIRHVLIIPQLKRLYEVFINKIFARVLLFLLGVWTIDYKYRKHNTTNIVPNIIFSSQSSVIDWLILVFNYSPKFLWTIKSDDSKSDYYIELSYLDLFIFSLGLKFLNTKNKYNKFDLENHILRPNQIPIVIFPENTKTNRKGILVIRSNLLDDIYNNINSHTKMLFRAEIIEHQFTYFSPKNTTEFYGFKTLFWTCSQIYNKVNIYSQDLTLSSGFDKSQEFDRKKFRNVTEFIDNNLQTYLCEPNNRQTVSLSSVDHILFLDYFNETQNSVKYVKKDI